MSFSSGTFSINSTGQPVVSGTVISSTAFNALTADLATGLSTCMLKDGTQTITANIPMGGFKFTGLGAGSASGNSLRYEQVNGVVTTAGDTLYATGAGVLARLAIGTARQQLATNSGASAPEWVASLQSLMTGTGDIVQSSSANTPARLAIGTARQVPTVNAGATALAYANPITIGTEAATTSGTTVSYTSLPAGIRRITIMFKGVSTGGTSNYTVQIGPSGGLENSGYLSRASNISASTGATTSFILTHSISNAADTVHGQIVLNLERASTFSWTCSGLLNIEGTTNGVQFCSGSKSLSAELTQLQISTVSGDTFDAGAINISYE